jgi:hypothetical protein
LVIHLDFFEEGKCAIDLYIYTECRAIDRDETKQKKIEEDNQKRRKLKSNG